MRSQPPPPSSALLALLARSIVAAILTSPLTHHHPLTAAFGCGMDNVASKTEAYVVKLRAQQGCTTDDQRSQIDEHIVKKYSALLTKKTSEYFEGRAATADLLERHGCDACAARIQLARIVKARSDAGKGWLLSTAQPASALWAKGGRLSASEQYGGALRVAVASPPSVERLVERINATRSSGDAAAHAGMKLADALKSVAGMCVSFTIVCVCVCVSLMSRRARSRTSPSPLPTPSFTPQLGQVWGERPKLLACRVRRASRRCGAEALPQHAGAGGRGEHGVRGGVPRRRGVSPDARRLAGLQRPSHSGRHGHRWDCRGTYLLISRREGLEDDLTRFRFTARGGRARERERAAADSSEDACGVHHHL